MDQADTSGSACLKMVVTSRMLAENLRAFFVLSKGFGTGQA
jgi:hypothetical protein